MQKENNIVLPNDFYDYDKLREEGKLLDIDIRRPFVINDCLKEGKKQKFDPSKVLQVSSVSKYEFHLKVLNRSVSFVKKVWTLEGFEESFTDC